MINKQDAHHFIDKKSYQTKNHFFSVRFYPIFLFMHQHKLYFLGIKGEYLLMKLNGFFQLFQLFT
jgi:hypothetical protein